MTPRSANTSRAASRIRWRVASRRGDRCASPERPRPRPSPEAASGLRERGTGAGIHLRDRRLGRLRHGRSARRAARGPRSPWRDAPVLGRPSARAQGQPAFRCPSMPPSRPAAARAPSVSRLRIVRYTYVCDTLTYRIRLRILAGAVKRRNTPSARSTPGRAQRPDPGRHLMFERLGSWTYRFRFLILIAWIVGAVLHGRGRPEPVGPGSDGPDHLPARRTRHRASPRTPSSAPSPGARPRRRRPSRWTARAG